MYTNNPKTMASQTIDTETRPLSIPLLASLDLDRERWLMSRSTTRTRSKGEHVFYPKEVSGQVFFVLSGRVKVGTFATDGRETIRHLAYPGDMIGEQALHAETRRRDFATALDEEVTVLVVEVADLLTLMRSTADFAVEVMRHMAQRLQQAESRCDNAVFSDARTRIVDTLRDMALRHGQVLANGSVLLTHALTHQDLAALTATSRQTVTTVLNELKDREIINFDRRSILVHEMRTLM